MRQRLMLNKGAEENAAQLTLRSLFIRLALGLTIFVMLLIGWSMVSSAMQGLNGAIAPRQQSDLAEDRIYAYRDWQSVGIRVTEYDWIKVRAAGRWHYTPDEYHGPEGHPRFSAPSFYPASGRGGTLIGRVGETGPPFYIGRQMSFTAGREGMLYFRINDDVLSDNDGYVVVEVAVIEAEGKDEG